jgi:hypothetical protein
MPEANGVKATGCERGLCRVSAVVIEVRDRGRSFKDGTFEHGTDRRALHLADVFQMALQREVQTKARPYTEAGHVQDRPAALSKPAAAALLEGGLLAVGGVAWLA